MVHEGTDETIWVLDDCEYLSDDCLDKHRGEMIKAFENHIEKGDPLSSYEVNVIVKFGENSLTDALSSGKLRKRYSEVILDSTSLLILDSLYFYGRRT